VINIRAVLAGVVTVGALTFGLSTMPAAVIPSAASAAFAAELPEGWAVGDRLRRPIDGASATVNLDGYVVPDAGPPKNRMVNALTVPDALDAGWKKIPGIPGGT
jgi:hypothetical protein